MTSPIGAAENAAPHAMQKGPGEGGAPHRGHTASSFVVDVGVGGAGSVVSGGASGDTISPELG